MSTSKYFDRICLFAVIAALLLCAVLPKGTVQAGTMGYEDRLFDTSMVHTIDIRIDDWEAFLTTAQSEEYSLCDVVIDGESFADVGIRGKGNTSLSTVSSMDSDRYSFKIEFDQYDSTKSYYGLDKLSLNNLIQDNTMMKDYLTYQMMNEFGVAAPLSSFVYITVNGEDWGLYLAVEAVEESFLLRNYGSDYGELYKPDSMNMGGGRGNGKDFDPGALQEDAAAAATVMPGGGMQGMRQEGFDPARTDGTTSDASQVPENVDFSQTEGMMPGGNMGGGSMGSSETKLQYIDDDPESYSTIFDSAKTNVTEADQTRLIAALEALSAGEVSAVDMEAVLRYFVVHNYVVNGDSYTGSMIHNYYLYEEEGRLSMIPWDYNLAFGTFQGNQAASAVNDNIDAPLSVTGTDRPMIDWIFGSEEYTQQYHSYFQEFLNTVDAASIITQAKALIAPYVEKDPTKFCTYEEFEKGVETLSAFCTLRSQSIAAQLAGEDGSVDASFITLSDMGTMNNGFGGGRGQMSGMGGERTEAAEGAAPDAAAAGGLQMPQMPEQGGFQQMSGQSGTVNDTSGTDDSQQGQGAVGFQEGMQPGQDRITQSGFPDSGQAGTNTAQAASQWILLAITAAFLAAGLLFAFKFKR